MGRAPHLVAVMDGCCAVMLQHTLGVSGGVAMVLAVRDSCSLSLLLHFCRPPAQAEVRQVEPPQAQPPQVEMQQAASATSMPATPSSQYSAARLEQLMLNEELAFRGEHSTSNAVLFMGSMPLCILTETSRCCVGTGGIVRNVSPAASTDEGVRKSAQDRHWHEYLRSMRSP